MTARQPSFVSRVLQRLFPRRQPERSPRQELLDAFVARLNQRREIHASYDAAQDTDRMFSLDLVLFETEQCQTPYLPYDVVGDIDGIRFDDWGNPIH